MPHPIPIPLQGGYRKAVFRIADTVHRPHPERDSYTHAVLGFLHEQGWQGAPRYLGRDKAGLEVLGFIPGEVPWQDPIPDYVLQDSNLHLLGGLVRQLHDLTAGTSLAGREEVICHGDLSPRNTVYRDLGHGLEPVAFIDWDETAPGPAIRDVAHLCWQTLKVGPATTDLPITADRLRAICDGYGLADRTPLVTTIGKCQEDLCTGIEAGIAANNPDALTLRDLGALDIAYAEVSWTHQHRAELEQCMK